jgi:catechol 2,3-dioxygenase-like lactoylglutathione lyase family enzyme
MQCSCCDEQRDPGSLAALLCHDDIKICRTCIGWLMQQAGGVDVTPTLPVSDMDAAEAFYRRAGFEVRRYDDGFAFVTLDDQSVFDLGADARATPVHNAAGCYIISADTDAWHDRLVAAGLPATEIEAKPWGMREFSLADPSGNTIRIGRPLAPGTDA